MRKRSRESIVILFVCAFLALNYPLLDIFDRLWIPFGIPLLYLYLYIAWLVIIIALSMVIERSYTHGACEPDEMALTQLKSGQAEPRQHSIEHHTTDHPE